MPQTYQVHKLINVKTAEHRPIMIGLALSPANPARMSATAVEECWRIATADPKTYPCFRHPDGRVVTGQFVYVPEDASGQPTSLLVRCPDCSEESMPHRDMTISEHNSAWFTTCEGTGKPIRPEDWA